MLVKKFDLSLGEIAKMIDEYRTFGYDAELVPIKESGKPTEWGVLIGDNPLYQIKEV